jgi:excisionase family DNA binding protein
MIEKFFTTEQVANILQVHPFTILKFIKEGKLKGVKLGRMYRIKESDVKAFLEERMTGGTKTEKTEKKEEKTKTVRKPEKEEKEEPKHFKVENKDENDDQHYYVI